MVVERGDQVEEEEEEEEGGQGRGVEGKGGVEKKVRVGNEVGNGGWPRAAGKTDGNDGILYYVLVEQGRYTSSVGNDDQPSGPAPN